MIMSKSKNLKEIENQNNIIFDPNDYTRADADRICKKYNDRVPILVWELGTDIKMRKRKFIVPKDITMGQFLYIIRKQITDVSSVDGVYVFVTDKNIMIPVTELIAVVYDKNNVDGFLRLTVTKENTFG